MQQRRSTHVASLDGPFRTPPNGWVRTGPGRGDSCIGTGCHLTSSSSEHDPNDGRQPMAPVENVQSTASQEEPLVEETLVEEVSIDGMCGVY
ncbi:mycofactocin precursor [Pseudonocardia sp. N23]|nr:mycofactocin precursor [Pseudonocardia sp. N23]